MKGKIIVVTHKDYHMPQDDVYLPVCVGVGRDSLRDKFQSDDDGKNISDKNILYCEVTALYWAWKNLDFEYLGIAHYRRHFGRKKSNKLADVLTRNELEQILSDYEVVVPKSRHYFQTVAKHYINCIKSRRTDNAIQLKLLRETIGELYPDYLFQFDAVMNGHFAHMLNMFVMKKNDLNSYCEWLFSILFLLEERIIKNSVYYDRIMGAFSELLLDVWLKKNNKIIHETELVETEKDFFKKLKWALNRRMYE